MDGSLAKYYFREGYDSGKDNYIIFFQGGGWCYGLEDCYSRSLTGLGTSRFFQPTIEKNGLLNTSSSMSPDFYNWNVLFLPYCDGTSFSGNNTANYNDTTLYFSGFQILISTLYEGVKYHNLSSANKVLVTGGSAGGLATFLHLDFIETYLKQYNNNVQVFGASDAGKKNNKNFCRKKIDRNILLF